MNIDHVATLRQAAPHALSRPGAGRAAGRAGRRRQHHAAPARGPAPHPGARRAAAARAAADAHESRDGGHRRRCSQIACELRPADCCLVPERRAELTTEGGLDVVAGGRACASAARELAAAGIRVALFIDPDPRADRSRARSRRAGGRAAHRRLRGRGRRRRRRASSSGCGARRSSPRGLGLEVHAGHGLNYHNVQPVAALPRDRRAQHRSRHHRARAVRSAWRRRCATMKALMLAARA